MQVTSFLSLRSLLFKAAGLVLGSFVAVAPAKAVRAEEPPAFAPLAQPVTEGQIALWIEQLGSAQFAQREAATRCLTETGGAAIEPLAVAIKSGDLETASRAIEIVRQLLASDDLEVASQAEKFLETVAEGPNQPVSQLAESTLDFHLRGMMQAAREKLKSLGASILVGFLPSGRQGVVVALGTEWRGKSEDLRLLASVPGIVQLSLHGVRLDDAEVAIVGRMRGMERLELYGTGITDAAVAKLIQKLPGTRIDLRKGGKLGVAGQPMIGPCLITLVQPGSAAAKAGLQEGDVVVTIDGEPVDNFESLTTKVGKHGPDEIVQVEFERPQLVGKPERKTEHIKLEGC